MTTENEQVLDWLSDTVSSLTKAVVGLSAALTSFIYAKTTLETPSDGRKLCGDIIMNDCYEDISDATKRVTDTIGRIQFIFKSVTRAMEGSNGI